MPDEKSKRPGTVIGPRGEYRPRALTPGPGVKIDPDEFAEAKQPITNVGLTPIVELGARVERARNDSAASATVITSRLQQQDTEIAAMKSDVADVKKTVTVMQVDVAGLKPLVTSLERSAKRLEERDDLHFKATLQLDTAGKLADTRIKETSELDRLDARKARRWFLFKIFTSGVVGAVGLKVLQHYGVL